MLRSLTRAAGFALSVAIVLPEVHAAIEAPDQCWPDCNEYLENQQCIAWFGSAWYYCGWSNGYTWCCNGQ